MDKYLKFYQFDGVRYSRTRGDVAPFHFHGGWCLDDGPWTLAELAKWDNECSISTPEERQALLARHFNAFNFYLVPELGRYPVYYVESKRKAVK